MDTMDLDNFEPVARIVVIGVGGAGNNAVNRMMDEHIDNVEFYVLNTDKQALATSKAPNRIVIGEEVTKGLGAGGDPKKGKDAAEASEEKIAEIVKGANMVFVAAGMGGGTGTGAAPVVARIAKKSGALTIAIVTRPFNFEGKTRTANSVAGLSALKDAVDSIIIVSNDKLLMASGNAPIATAFQESDRVLAQSVKTVTDLILLPAVINLDFADVKSTLEDSGLALIGFGMGTGKNKAQEAAENAINSPLLEASIAGARKAICAVTCGANVSLYDAEECVNDALLSAWNSIPPKRPENLKAYLGMLVRNASVNRRLRNNAKKRLPKSLGSLEELGEIAAFRDVDGEVGARELASLISDFVRSLGTTERNVFIRRYWYYDSIDEICKRCGFGKSKVKMMLKRTRDSLAEYLKEEADYEL